MRSALRLAIAAIQQQCCGAPRRRLPHGSKWSRRSGSNGRDGADLNTLCEPGNKDSVSRAARFAVPFLALPALWGCGSPARAPGPPGETLILLENRVNGPCELQWAHVRVDDRPLALATITPPGASAATLDRPVLAPGEHTLSIVASASCPTPGAAEHATVLQATTPVYMGTTGGKITISLASKPGGGDAGMVASFAVAGGEVLAPRADGGEVDCRARLPIDGAVCRTEAMLARARERRDLVRALCVNDKLREMRLLADTLQPSAAGDGPLGDVAADAARRVLLLATEAELCSGEDSFAEGGTRMDRVLQRNVPAFQ
jgi:hypothetical protein